MGRHLRFKLPGIPQLITQRGHNRLPCFMDGADYSEFQSILETSAAANNCHVDALLLLPHAYWLLATPQCEQGISKMIQRTGRCYVRYCNGKYRREGTLWASRYHACVVEPSQQSMRQCLAFLHHVPVSEGVASEGTTWPWLTVDSELALDDVEMDKASFTRMASLLHKGLVWGSEDFRQKISKEAGIPTEPARRGRPPKVDSAAPTPAAVTGTQ